ncbi:MAG: LacI family DNA-binding transcriptional regulator [Anaerolineae bacterium]|nr:LacI family DNA-binding transcriptional regulator [Anaerolineae bacterium]
MRRVTIKDIAREAGVSAQTVSRAINDKGEVSPQTQARVLDIAQRMGYRPNSIARSLVSSRTHNIGLVVPDVANPFFSEIARGIEDAAHEADYNVFLCNAAENLQREIKAIHSLEAQRVDGLILCSSRLSEQELEQLARRYQPLVLVNRRLSNVPAGLVLIDDAGGAARAVEHLIALGHRNIGLLAGPPNSHSGRERTQGYWQTMDAHGLIPKAHWQTHCAPRAEEGHAASLKLLQRAPELTALLAFNDLVAVGAMRACRDLGVDVPGAFSIVGFDDISLAALVSPALTTIHIPKYQLGRQAMALIVELMAEREGSPAEAIVLNTELMIRGTTAACPTGALD